MNIPACWRTKTRLFRSVERCARHPLKWPKEVSVYMNLLSRLLAKRRLKNLAGYQWEKDASSRA